MRPYTPKVAALAVLTSLGVSVCSHSLLARQSDKPAYFQQRVNYRIEVALDTQRHLLHGSWTMDYTNRAPVALDSMYLHLYPNAYQGRRTAFARQQVQSGSRRFHFAPDSSRGGMDSLDFSANGQALRWRFLHPDSPDIAVVYLDQPLKSGATLRMSSPFRVRIPGDFSRMGRVGTQYQLTQWYPKPAVFDREGWHPMPYLDQGEFYSEFGDFEVEITVPSHYRVAASGELHTESEKTWLDSLATAHAGLDTFPPLLNATTPGASVKRLRYVLNNAHDFAWFCAPDYYVHRSRVRLEGRQEEVQTYAFFTGRRKEWSRAVSYVDSSLFYYSRWLGPYPYGTCTAVEGALRAGGGMEYPTITVISAPGDSMGLETVVAHEVGHNWFYGILASNERDHPFMDEGFNSYYESRYLRHRFPKTNPFEAALRGVPPVLQKALGPLPDLNHTLVNFSLRRGKNLSLWHSHSTDYDGETYGSLVYKRTALELDYLEAYLGKEEMDRRMQRYFRDWQFRHPAPEDLLRALSEPSEQGRAEAGQVSLPSKSVAWWFDHRMIQAKSLDYRLLREEIRPQGDGWQVGAVVRGRGTPSPLLVAVTDTAGRPIRQEWIEGFEGRRSLNFQVPVQPGGVVLDPDYKMPLLYRKQAKSKAWWKPSLPVDLQGQRGTWLPWLTYLGTEGWTPGMVWTSPLVLPPALQYRSLLQYGTWSKAWSGMALVDYRWYSAKATGPQWKASLHWRRFERLGPFNGGTVHGALRRQDASVPNSKSWRKSLELGWRQRYNGASGEVWNAGRKVGEFADQQVIPEGIWPYVRGDWRLGNAVSEQGWGWMLQTGLSPARPARLEAYHQWRQRWGNSRSEWAFQMRLWGAFAPAYRQEDVEGGRLLDAYKDGVGLFGPAGLGGAQDYTAQDILWARPQMTDLSAFTDQDRLRAWTSDPAWKGLGGRQVILRESGFKTPAGPYSQYLLQHISGPMTYQVAVNLELDLPRSYLRLPLTAFVNLQRNQWHGLTPLSPLQTVADLLPDQDPWLATLPALSYEAGLSLKWGTLLQVHWLPLLSRDMERNFEYPGSTAKTPWYARWSWTLNLTVLDIQQALF